MCNLVFHVFLFKDILLSLYCALISPELTPERSSCNTRTSPVRARHSCPALRTPDGPSALLLGGILHSETTNQKQKMQNPWHRVDLERDACSGSPCPPELGPCVGDSAFAALLTSVAGSESTAHIDVGVMSEFW